MKLKSSSVIIAILAILVACGAFMYSKYKYSANQTGFDNTFHNPAPLESSQNETAQANNKFAVSY